MNVAHNEIDLENPKQPKNAGFSDEERGKFNELLNAGFIDTFRYFTLTKKRLTPGGATCNKQGIKTLVGALIIFYALTL